MYRDYFFNYIDLGIDILFDGFTHKISKFILHSNKLGHPDFNRWCKCNFSIILANDPHSNQSVITAQSKWKDIVEYLGPCPGPPIMYRSSHGQIQNVNKENGDGKEESIKIYAFPSVLFEIMGNNSISTVTLFHEENYAAKMNENGINTMSPHGRSSPMFEDRMAPIQRVQSIYELPATQYIPASPQHHSRINPSPLSKSIEEAARSQMQFKGPEEKYSKKSHKKRKEKRRKRGSRSKSGSTVSAVQQTPQHAVVEIDAPVATVVVEQEQVGVTVVQEVEQDEREVNVMDNVPVNEMNDANETFDNITL